MIGIYLHKQEMGEVKRQPSPGKLDDLGFRGFDVYMKYAKKEATNMGVWNHRNDMMMEEQI